MPWSVEDVETHIKGLSPVQKRVWTTVANSVLAGCTRAGKEQAECEASAIRQANAMARQTKSNENGEPVAIYWEDSAGWIFEYTADRYQLSNIEIFSSGTWNGDTYTKKDLDAMVEAFNTFKASWRPVLKLGHQAKQEQPSLGDITELSRKGDKLIATVTNIPKIIYQAIKKGLFKRVSSEVYWNYLDGKTKKRYPRVLRAIALLGASIPAVSNLKELEVFFSSDLDYHEYTFDMCSDYSKLTKTEDGIPYPKEAFAYVPDENKPSTWKLRIWEDGEKKVTRVQLGRAAAALSPGGFRGNKVDIPTDDIKAVKSRLQELYSSLQVKKEDMPKHIFELAVDKGDKSMDFEEIIKGLKEEIEQYKAKIAEYEKKDVDGKLAEYTAALEAKDAELERISAYKEEAINAAEKIKQLEEDNKLYSEQLNNLSQAAKKAEVASYVQANGVTGTKKILPKHVELVTQILLAAPEQKDYSIDGVEGKASVSDMVKKFISELPELVTFSEKGTGTDNTREYGDDAKHELAERAAKYMAEHPVEYVDAMKAVLAEDPELKSRYFGYTTGVCE